MPTVFYNDRAVTLEKWTAEELGLETGDDINIDMLVTILLIEREHSRDRIYDQHE